MIESKQVLINEYVKALRSNTASVFVGAGFSCDLVHFDWNKLIEPFRKKLGLTKKTLIDNPTIAQYYLNESKTEVTALKQKVSQAFHTDKFQHKHELLAKMPIRNYWTTNYDPIIENALKFVKKKFEKKNSNSEFAKTETERQALVFKVHGDIDAPEHIVLTQDDYDGYESTHPNFYTALENELALNNMLFIGYSFNDPDIKNILKKLKAKNSSIGPNHFFIVKRETKRAARKEQLLFLQDIEKYGIFSLIIDEYNEIEEILEAIYKQYMSYKILISGSAHDYSEYGTEEESKELIYDLGYNLVQQDQGYGLKVINGNGFGVGPSLYEGIAEATALNDLDMADYLKLYPFPKKYYSLYEKPDFMEKIFNPYREKMIEQCGAVFFLFGNKKDENGNIINADGVKKEFDIAVNKKKYVFPVGATGYTAKKLAELVLSDFENYNGNMPNIKKKLEKLNTPKLPKKEIIETILSIIEILAFRPELK